MNQCICKCVDFIALIAKQHLLLFFSHGVSVKKIENGPVMHFCKKQIIKLYQYAVMEVLFNEPVCDSLNMTLRVVCGILPTKEMCSITQIA